jgi:hypothetical protein
MKYGEIVEVVRCSWIDSSDVKDLVEILSDDEMGWSR